MDSNILKFRITFKQQFILLAHLFLLWLVLILAFKYYLNLSLFDPITLIVFSFTALVDALPTIILHIQYWIRNRNATLIIDKGLKHITYESKTNKEVKLFENISSLHYYRTYGKGSGWNSFGMYRYYKIKFNDHSEMTITCLMINDIENVLEVLLGVSSQRHFKLLCLIYFR